MARNEIAPLTEAEKELVERNLHVAEIAAKRASKGRSRQVLYEDSLSSAAYGMIRSVKRYDSSKGATFSTSCMSRARGQISDDLRERSKWFYYGPRDKSVVMDSLDRKPQGSQGYENNHSLGQCICSKEPPVGSGAEQREEFEKLIEPLDKREKMVMRMIFLEESGMAEIGKLLGIHESRVSQIKTESLEKLRAYHLKEKQNADCHR